MHLILAAIGLIESLMTLNLIDELTETRGNSNRECIAQGGANIITGIFGGMGGCAMIGQSIINIKGGGRGRLSGIVAALAVVGIYLICVGSYRTSSDCRIGRRDVHGGDWYVCMV